MYKLTTCVGYCISNPPMKSTKAIFLFLAVTYSLSAFCMLNGSPLSQPIDRVGHLITMTPRGDNSFIQGDCLGTLINDQIILTAAHCMSSIKGSIFLFEILSQKIKIIDYSVHPSSEDKKSKTWFGDLAVLKLETAPKTIESIPSITLSKSFPKSRKCFTGIGVENLDLFSEKLVYNQAEFCITKIAKYGKDQILTEANTDISPNAVTEHGDSGGPLFDFTSRDETKIIGVLSNGIFSKSKQKITSQNYISIGYHIDWINNTIRLLMEKSN